MRASAAIVLVLCVLFAAWSSVLPAEAGIASGGAVVKLTNSNFKEKVYDSDQVWMVAFVAPWCGHCQRLAPEWAKAAESMKGIVLFGAVNCDEEKELASKYGIQGFPTIKVFGPGKKSGPSSASSYEGARSANAIANHAASLLPNFVKRLKKADEAQAFFASEKPKAVLFTNKATTPLLFKSLAHDFKKVMDFAEIREADKELVAKYASEGATLPLVKVFADAVSSDQEVVTTGVAYDGKIDKIKLGLWLAGFVNVNNNAEDVAESAGEKKAKVKKVTVEPDFAVLHTVDELRETSNRSAQHNRVVAIFIVPEASGRAHVRDVAEAYHNDPIAFIAAVADSPLAEIWNPVAGAPKVGADKARLMLVKPKKGRIAFVTDIEPTDDDEEGFQFSMAGVKTALDRVVGGDLQFRGLPISAEDGRDWIDALLHPRGSGDLRSDEL